MARARMIGAYQPRARRAELLDALEDARHAFLHLARTVVYRGAGAALLIASFLSLAALLTYNAHDTSLSVSSGAPSSNALGAVGATAADLLLEGFGLAAICALAAPALWGA